MNKQRRGDYGNAQNTVPTAAGIPNTPDRGVAHAKPSFTPISHPFRKSGGAKTKL